jgi:hypothetical protein
LFLCYSIVGYRGNLVYRAVASMPLSVTGGRFSWEAPTMQILKYVQNRVHMESIFVNVDGLSDS